MLAWPASPRDEDAAAALGLCDLRDVDESSVRKLQPRGASPGVTRDRNRLLMAREESGRPQALDTPTGDESLLGNPSSMTDVPAGVSEHEKSQHFSR